MKRILSTAFAAVIAVAINVAMVPDAEAKRFGGGLSSGMKRNSSIMQRSTAPTQAAKPAPSQTATPTPVTATPRTGMSRWMGPIAGLAAGLGIAALLSHFGLGAGVANFVMILLLAMAAMFVFRLIFGRKPAQSRQGLQYAGVGNAPAPQRDDPMQFNAGYEAVHSAPAEAASIPAGFDVPGFLRQAKLNFVRLQAANDRGDMADIRNFTGPELFAEIQMQYEERGRSEQQTDVVQLDADLLDVSMEGDNEVASVRFYGQIRELADAAPQHFNEVWHLLRPHDGSRGWVVAGVQQAEG